MRPFNLVTLVAIAVVAQTTTTLAKTVKCSVNVSPTTCGKGQYCQAGKTSSYCAKKLTGGSECDKDEACVSNICFIAKKNKSGKLGKRTCAPLPTKDYPLKARCTASKQCKSTFCSEGFCETPVSSGEKCTKDDGCAGERTCLKKSETFIVYDKAGKKSTKKLSAGHCSYIKNLGQGMTCANNSNCFKEKFQCSKATKKCIPIVAPTLSYKDTCSAASQCSSKRCVDDICGCDSDGSDCNATTEYCSDLALCQAKRSYGKDCSSNIGCLSNACVGNGGVQRRGATPFKKICGCTGDKDCEDDQVCDSDKLCKNTYYPYLHQCATNAQCLSGVCEDGSCACQPQSVDCGDGRFCDQSNTCTAQKPYGQWCSGDEMCTDGFCTPGGTCGCGTDDSCPSSQWCDNSTALCTAQLSSSSSCLRDRACKSLDCNEGTCGCAGDADCQSNQFCSDFCYAKQNAATECDTNNQCISNICHNGFCGCENDTQCQMAGYELCSGEVCVS